MENTNNSLSPQSLQAMRSSLQVLNKVCDALIGALDRSPEQVSQYTGVFAQRLQKANDGDGLYVDVLARGLKIIDLHLDAILQSVTTHTLYDRSYNTQPVSTESLIAALQNKWDILIQKRRSNGFINQTFGSYFDDLTQKIDKIYEAIPLHTQKAA